MNKIFVNITSWTRVGSAGSQHFYGKIYEFQNEGDIYILARAGWDTCELGECTKSELRKTLTKSEAEYLNQKDRYSDLYKKGDKTDRFDSIEEIKETTKKQYPNTDIAFFNDHELLSEDMDIYEADPQTIYKKTGKKIRIQNFEGFSKEFVNLTEGSIHEVIETPEKYKYKELEDGVWVWGVTEPVLVLRREFEYIN